MEAVKHIAQWEELMQTIDGLDNLFVLHRLGVGVVDVLLGLRIPGQIAPLILGHP